MKLEEFIKETLSEIYQGVKQARKSNSGVAPKISSADTDPKTLKTEVGAHAVFLVEFDVAVTATEKAGMTGGGGIAVWGVASAKGEGSKSTENTTANRIKFSVPILYH